MDILDDVERHRQDIVTDTYTATWREIIGQYKDNELVIAPEYQRLFRWDVDQQTQYIESILLSIPSPPIFLARNPDGKAEVIDGLQRVSSLLKFFAEDISGANIPAPTAPDEREQNNIAVPMRLAAGPLLPSLEGFTAATLPETLVRTIKYARITIILLEKESSPRARYEVFKRLNKLGSPLSDQEIRNCTARLLGRDFPEQLRRLATNTTIRAALSLSEEAERKMGIEECLLRLLAINFSEKPLKHEVSEYLDAFMAFASEGKFTLSDEGEQTIGSTFALVQEALPDGRGFRFPKSGFSTNLFDIVATGVFHNLDHLTAPLLQSKFDSLLNSSEIKELTGAGSNTRKKFEGRITLGKTWFSE